jgi:hypothetical protein
MRPIITALIVLAFTCGVATAEPAQSGDRAKIDACLKDAGDRPESCIGTVYTPCSDTPAGGTTAGMVDCAARETAIWMEKVNANLKALRSGDLGKAEADPANRPNENPAQEQSQWRGHSRRHAEDLALLACQEMRHHGHAG